MGCCRSRASQEEREESRPLLRRRGSSECHSSAERSREEASQPLPHSEVQNKDNGEEPKWNPKAELRAIEERLESQMIDISILDRHAFVPRARSPSPKPKRSTGDESPPMPSLISRIHAIRFPPVKLTGPPSVADALAKPLPSQEELQWWQEQGDRIAAELREDVRRKTTPKRPLFRVLPFPPPLFEPPP